MSPEPALELAHPRALIEVGHPSCRQTTETSFRLQLFLHTVPHFSRILSSTLPVQWFSPPVSLSSFFTPPAITIEHSSDGQAEFREQAVLRLRAYDLESEWRPSWPHGGTTAECYFTAPDSIISSTGFKQNNGKTGTANSTVIYGILVVWLCLFSHGSLYLLEMHRESQGELHVVLPVINPVEIKLTVTMWGWKNKLKEIKYPFHTFT